MIKINFWIAFLQIMRFSKKFLPRKMLRVWQHCAQSISLDHSKISIFNHFILTVTVEKNSSESQNCNHYSVFLFTWRQTTAKPNNILDDHKSLKGLICVFTFVYQYLNLSQCFLSFIQWILLYILLRKSKPKSFNIIPAQV